VKKIISKARENDLGVGIHLSEGAQLQIKWAKMGANIILHGSDINLFQQRLKADITDIRRALGEEKGEIREEKDIKI
jgi:4-hydroxy-2-oxoheptanedioate aldolase